MIEQGLHGAHVATVGGHDERRDAVVPPRAHIRPVGQQPLNRRAAVVACDNESVGSILQGHLWRGAALEHLVNDGLIAVRRAEEEAAIGVHRARDRHHLLLG